MANKGENNKKRPRISLTRGRKLNRPEKPVTSGRCMESESWPSSNACTVARRCTQLQRQLRYLGASL
jgi:hypothetical protein